MTKAHLLVSEQFYSIQGEGMSAGVPAVFLRLGGCNLRCNGFSYKNPDTGEHLGCDSKLVWTRADKMSFSALVDFWEQEGWLDKLKQGAHLVVTGGEPLIQQAALANFIARLDPRIYIEMETNGTIKPNDYLRDRLQQFNVSPKLHHSGERRDKAYFPDVLKTFSALPKSTFKFVIATPEDINEVLADYAQPFHIPHQKIWLMPEGGTREAIHDKSAFIVELCKQYLMHYGPRLHVDIWQEVTGV